MGVYGNRYTHYCTCRGCGQNRVQGAVIKGIGAMCRRCAKAWKGTDVYVEVSH